MSDERTRGMARALANFGVTVDADARPRRPDWCGGALLKDFDREGKAVDRRVPCAGTVEGRFALCSRCSNLEAENRRDLRERVDSRRVAPAKRGFRENSE